MLEMVSIFSGLGGLDAGLESAGWDCAYASDLDIHAVQTLRKNRGYMFENGFRFMDRALLEQADIRDLSGREIFGKSARRKGDIQLLAGGPPCQSWSSAGHQLGFSDPRGQLIKEYLRLAEELDCRFLVFENVRGLITARGSDGIPGSALGWLRDELFKSGWQTQVHLLNAADFGVAQRRVRVFIIGYRDGDAPSAPTPTHTKSGGGGTARWQTLRECLAKIDPCDEREVIRPSEKMMEELKILRPGTGLKSPGKKETTRPGGHWGYKQGAFLADLDLPARTVTANSQQDWILDDAWGIRRLNPRECAALQSFPREWEYSGKRNDQYRLIGNAVPFQLARAVGRSLVDKIEEKSFPAVGTLRPLPDIIQSAIRYTIKEEKRNGQSRREAPNRRRFKMEMCR